MGRSGSLAVVLPFELLSVFGEIGAPLGASLGEGKPWLSPERLKEGSALALPPRHSALGAAAKAVVASLDEFVEKGQLECLNEDKDGKGREAQGNAGGEPIQDSEWRGAPGAQHLGPKSGHGPQLRREC